MKWYLNVAFIVLVLITTLLIRVPVPGAGYFNLGDVIIVFAALVCGKYGGLLAGGIGSALADVIGGFPIFAPVTLIAKGGLGFIAGLGKGDSILPTIIFPLLGEILMVAVYFGGTWLMPNLGIVAALADLVPNLVQAASGLIGGRLLFAAYQAVESK